MRNQLLLQIIPIHNYLLPVSNREQVVFDNSSLSRGENRAAELLAIRIASGRTFFVKGNANPLVAIADKFRIYPQQRLEIYLELLRKIQAIEYDLNQGTQLEERIAGKDKWVVIPADLEGQLRDTKQAIEGRICAILLNRGQSKKINWSKLSGSTLPLLRSIRDVDSANFRGHNALDLLEAISQVHPDSPIDRAFHDHMFKALQQVAKHDVDAKNSSRFFDLCVEHAYYPEAMAVVIESVVKSPYLIQERIDQILDKVESSKFERKENWLGALLDNVRYKAVKDGLVALSLKPSPAQRLIPHPNHSRLLKMQDAHSFAGRVSSTMKLLGNKNPIFVENLSDHAVESRVVLLSKQFLGIPLMRLTLRATQASNLLDEGPRKRGVQTRLANRVLKTLERPGLSRTR